MQTNARALVRVDVTPRMESTTAAPVNAQMSSRSYGRPGAARTTLISSLNSELEGKEAGCADKKLLWEGAQALVNSAMRCQLFSPLSLSKSTCSTRRKDEETLQRRRASVNMRKYPRTGKRKYPPYLLCVSL